MLALSACGGTNSEPEEPEQACGGTHSFPQAEPTTQQAPANEADAIAPRIELRDGSVLVDGQRLAPVDPVGLKKVEPLFQHLKAHGEVNAAAPRRYRLSASDDTTLSAFKSVFQTTAFAGRPLAVLEPSGVELHALIPLPPGAPNAPQSLDWPEQALLIVVHADRTELWRIPAFVGHEPNDATDQTAATAPAKLLGKFEPDARSFTTALAQHCSATAPCSPALLFAAGEQPFSRVRPLFQALNDVTTSSGQAPAKVQFRIHEPKELPDPQTMAGRLRVGATAVSGRLPPEVIQKTVRDNYALVRQCYSAGLGRTPNLTGRIVVRFVIARDGSVAEVVASDGTSLPDAQVVDCVLAAFRQLKFPQPEGGIVSVVYPLQLSPE